MKKRTKAEFQKTLQKIVGGKIGKLTVISIQERKSFKEHTSCLCLCECGKEKSIRFHWLEQGDLVSCGCWKKTSNKKNDSFLDKIEKTENCWIWKGWINKKIGYGRFKHKYAHRLSYQHFKGEIPKDKIICHTCNNKICVNPDHMYLGTPYDNAQDAKRDGVYEKRSLTSKRWQKR